MLVHGVKERKTGFIMAWMVLQMIGIVCTAILAVACVGLYIYIGNDPGVSGFQTLSLIL